MCVYIYIQVYKVKNFKDCILHVWVFYLPVNHVCAWYLQWLEEDIESPRTGVADHCELS